MYAGQLERTEQIFMGMLGSEKKEAWNGCLVGVRSKKKSVSDSKNQRGRSNILK